MAEDWDLGSNSLSKTLQFSDFWPFHPILTRRRRGELREVGKA
jgi:hypothetical protein